MVGAITVLLAGCGGDGAGSGTAGGGGDIVLTRNAALGARYGAAGPRSCAPKNVPGDGAPSPAQAAKYVICAAEGETASNLYLLGKVVVTAIAPGRPYNPNEDINMGNVDVTKPIYAIRGSADSFQCRQINRPGGYDMGQEYEPGHNCAVTHYKEAQGACYKDTFGDWHCSMIDVNAATNEERAVAAPTD